MRLRAQSDLEWKLFGDSLQHLQAMELEYTRQVTRRQDIANERAYTEKKQAEERARFQTGGVGKLYPGATSVAEANILQDREQAEQRIAIGKEAVQELETYKKTLLADMEKNGATVGEMELVRVADKDTDMRMAYAQFASRKNQEANRADRGERFDEGRLPKPWDVFRQGSTEWFNLRRDQRRFLDEEAAKTGKTGMQVFMDDYGQKWEQFQMQEAAKGSALQPGIPSPQVQRDFQESLGISAARKAQGSPVDAQGRPAVNVPDAQAVPDAAQEVDLRSLAVYARGEKGTKEQQKKAQEILNIKGYQWQTTKSSTAY